MGECEMGNTVTDAMLARVADQGVTIAITNGGGLRASLQEGPTTMGDVLSVLPFQNTLATLKLTGAEIVEALEAGVSAVEEGAGRFPQVSGLRLRLDTSKAPNATDMSPMSKCATARTRAPIDPDADVYGGNERLHGQWRRRLCRLRGERPRPVRLRHRPRQRRSPSSSPTTNPSRR